MQKNGGRSYHWAMNASNTKWLDWATVQQHILYSFEYFTGASCYLVPADQFQTWICLNSAPAHEEIKDIETHFGQFDWNDFNSRHCERVLNTRRHVVTERSGHWEYYVPMFRSGRVKAIIVSGVIYRSFPDRVGLEQQWKKWTGSLPAPDDPFFMRFVRAVFRQSILEPPVERAHLELMHLLAIAVARQGDSRAVYKRSLRILEDVLAKHLLCKDWCQRVMNPKGVLPAPVWPGGRFKRVGKQDHRFDPLADDGTPGGSGRESRVRARSGRSIHPATAVRA
jgi:hypothetical protein